MYGELSVCVVTFATELKAYKVYDFYSEKLLSVVTRANENRI